MGITHKKLVVLLLIPFLITFAFGLNLKVSAFDLFGRACNGNQVQGGINDGRAKKVKSPVCTSNNEASGSNKKDNVVLDTIHQAINIVAVVTGLAAVLMVVIAGFSYATAGGNSEEVKKAKNRILWAAVGLIIISLAWTITSFITDKVL
jgi:cytochrome bd-type quinol oxidase subunit 2